MIDDAMPAETSGEVGPVIESTPAPAETWYYYVKWGPKQGTWRAVREDDWKRRRGDDVAFETALAVNALATSQGQPEGTSYKGAFYIDVDSDTPTKAISLANKVVRQLRKSNVPDESIRVWASGKKGFHFTVPMSVFTTDRSCPHLPVTWKFVAQAMKLPEGVDWQVYSQGRGRMWRVPGVQRIDNGCYKVPLTLTELESLTPAEYQTLVSTPRPEFEPAVDALVPFLRGMYRLAKEKAKKEGVATRVFVDPSVLKELGRELPACGKLLLEGEVDRTKHGFNEYSVQFGKVLAAFAPINSEELIDEFCDKVPFDNYNQKSARVEHVRKSYARARRSEQYGWSCRSMLDVLENKDPCDGCPLEGEKSGKRCKPLTRSDLTTGVIDLNSDPNAALPVYGHVQAAPVEVPEAEEPEVRRAPGHEEEDPAPVVPAKGPEAETEVRTESRKPDPEEDDEVIGVEYDLVLLPEGYGFLNPTGGVRTVCNFQLKISQCFMGWNPMLNQYRRAAVLAEVRLGGRVAGTVMIEDDSWDSRGSFLKNFTGVGNAVWYGKDDDIQKLKGALMNDVENRTNQVKRVEACGIHYEKVAGKDVFTYVEPNWSVDNLGLVNTHTLQGGERDHFPSLRRAPDSLPEDIGEFLDAVMSLNEPLVVAQEMFWVAACHLKQHIMTIRREFPILGCHGPAGSGKTQGIMRMIAALHGSDYFGKASELQLPTATPFVVWHTASTTTTIPVVMDEYNKSRMEVRRYNSIGDIVKASYQMGSVDRGTVDKSRSVGKSAFGAEVVSLPLRAPIALLSEQAPTGQPAITDRSVQVEVRPQGLTWNGGVPRESFLYIGRNRETCGALARALMLHAVRSSREQVEAWMTASYREVPLTLGDRPQLGYCVLFTGFEFLRDFMLRNGLRAQVPRLEGLRDTLRSFLTDEGKSIGQVKRKTEIDFVLEKMAEMAALTGDELKMISLSPDIHYMIRDGRLYLDVIKSFSAYKRYSVQVDRKEPVIESIAVFKALIKSEPYVISMEVAHPDFTATGGRPCIEIDLEMLQDKGVEVSTFIDTTGMMTLQ